MEKYDDILLLVNQAIDEYFEEKDRFVFKNTGESKGFQYRTIASAKSIEKEIKKCIYPGCKNLSIRRSHTVQRASLEIISDNQHLLSPAVKEGNLIMKSIGINEASTFPGFCQSHENVFKEFEQYKEFTTFKDFQLQLFRTICREIVFMQSKITGYEMIKDEYISFRNTQLSKRIEELIGSREAISIKKLNIKCDDWRIRKVNSELKRLSVLLNFLKRQYRRIFSDIKQNTEKKFSIHTVELDWIIPLVLAGIVNFNVGFKNTSHNIYMFVNVIPLENKTLVLIGGDKREDEYISAYVDMLHNPLQVLNIIERWMIYGTDHWFLKPSIWNEIPNKRKELILTKMWDLRYNVGHNNDLSIFDSIRRSFIEIAKQNKIYYTNNEKFIIQEENKIS